MNWVLVQAVLLALQLVALAICIRANVSAARQLRETRRRLRGLD